MHPFLPCSLGGLVLFSYANDALYSQRAAAELWPINGEETPS